MNNLPADTPVPPLHPNCRSQLVPKVSGIGLIGDQPSVGGRNFRKDAKAAYLRKQKAAGLDDKTASGKLKIKSWAQVDEIFM